MNHPEKKALFVIPSPQDVSNREKGLLSWSRPHLITMVQDEGVDMLVARGADSIDSDESVVKDVIRPEFNDTKDRVAVQSLGDVSLGEFGVVRSIVRPVDANTPVTFLNPNSIRRLARNKYDVAGSILSPAGVYERGVDLINVEDSLDDRRQKIAATPGDMVVLKPNGGMRSRGVFVGSKRDAENFSRTIVEPYIIEEKLNFHHELPVIKGQDPNQQARLDYANEHGVNREIRTFYFGESEDIDVVARVAQVGEQNFLDDKWLFVDQAHVPEEISRGMRSVATLLKDRLGSYDYNIALDWVYASTASNPQPHWSVMELNANEPQLVFPEQDETVGLRQHRKLARQITKLALE